MRRLIYVHSLIVTIVYHACGRADVLQLITSVVWLYRYRDELSIRLHQIQQSSGEEFSVVVPGGWQAMLANASDRLTPLSAPLRSALHVRLDEKLLLRALIRRCQSFLR